ncbi:MAG: hypothetical protein H6Q69_4849 [Firmicutes bacterium]|nr:hypothetical protein [Bacillota bacterium]
MPVPTSHGYMSHAKNSRTGFPGLFEVRELFFYEKKGLPYYF